MSIRIRMGLITPTLVSIGMSFASKIYLAKGVTFIKWSSSTSSLFSKREERRLIFSLTINFNNGDYSCFMAYSKKFAPCRWINHQVMAMAIVKHIISAIWWTQVWVVEIVFCNAVRLRTIEPSLGLRIDGSVMHQTAL